MLRNTIKFIKQPISWRQFPAISVTLIMWALLAGCGERGSVDVAGLEVSSQSRNDRVRITIDRAEWDSEDRELKARGEAPEGTTVTIKNAANGAVLGTANANRTRGDRDDDERNGSDENRSSAQWRFTLKNPQSVPCRILASGSGSSTEKKVEKAPKNCDQSTPPPPSNQAPNGRILSPAQDTAITMGESIDFTAQAEDPDGDTQLNYAWDFGGGAPNTTQLNPGAVTFASAGQYTVTFTVTDSNGAEDPTPDSRLIRVTSPDGNPPDTSHAGRFDTYEGSKTCMGCHETEVNEMHASLHYQWNGPTPNVAGMTSGGKMHGINDFCGYPDVNFIGQLTNLAGETVDGGCAVCHTGMGAKPDPVATQTQLENIDCLTCHSDNYRRKVVRRADNSFHFEVAPEKMTVPVLQAITDIRRTPSRGACVNCHSYAGGGCNNKRGDLEEEHRNPASAEFDVHMAPTAVGGAGLVCVDCHTTQNHRIAGRGVDLQVTDLNQPVRCTNCHNIRPHSNGDINQHTAKVDCTVCHIPRYAKIVSTDMIRDYSKPAVLDTERQLYDPNIVRGANLAPEIGFWNGTSRFYQFGTEAVPGTSGRVLMAGPVGDITDNSAKLFAFKHHLAVLPHDPVTGRILPMKIGIILQTGNLSAAITTATAEVGWSLPQGYDFIEAERYMGLFHEVSPAGAALGCNDCHNGGTRVNFSALGYDPLAQRDPDIAANCANGCHGDQSDEWSPSTFFVQVHNRHVDGEGFNCSRCHSFSR